MASSFALRPRDPDPWSAFLEDLSELCGDQSSACAMGSFFTASDAIHVHA